MGEDWEGVGKIKKDPEHIIQGLFLLARDLQEILEYSEWRNFSKIIEKAKTACKASGHAALSEFVDINKLVDIGSKQLIEEINASKQTVFTLLNKMVDQNILISSDKAKKQNIYLSKIIEYYR